MNTTTKVPQVKGEHSELPADPLGAYLVRIGRIPPLTAEQELRLARIVQRSLRLQEIRKELLEQGNSELTEADWAAAAGMSVKDLREALRSGRKARNQMIEANLKFVVSLAKRYRNRGLDFLDLIQEGNLGLERGVRKFDPTRGYRFTTCAYLWIRQAITRALNYKSRPIRLPEKVTAKKRKIEKTRQELTESLKREPTREELQAVVEFTPEEMAQIRRWCQKTVSLDSKISNEEGNAWYELVPDEREKPHEWFDQNKTYDDVRDIVSELPDEQQKVLGLRYGLNSERPHNITATAAKLNISREKVRRLEGRAQLYIKIRAHYVED